MRTLLGFDYGKLRIGIAVGQDITGTATALCTLVCTNGKPVWESIDRLIAEWSPDTLVVGLPLRADGTDSEISRAARNFARQLEGRYQLPVQTMDEHLSSHAARELGRKTGGRGGGNIDALAAMIILQNWLDATTHT